MNIKALFPTRLKQYIFKKFYSRRHPDKVIAGIFRSRFGREIDLDNPADINEKIQWLKLHTDPGKWALLSDKYRVREFITEKGYADNLVPLLGMYRKASEIDFSTLPDSFVIKTNFRSGDTLIVKDKANIDTQKVKEDFNRLMHTPFGEQLVERQYSLIDRRIVIEEMLRAEEQLAPSTSLVDYKFWCFHGRPRYIEVIFNRVGETMDEQVYTPDWQLRPGAIRTHVHCHAPVAPMPRPEGLERMVQMARDLSADFPVVRVDLYNIAGKVYFGEMTFTPAGGFEGSFTDEFLLELGNELRLPGK